ncbi:peptidoglycan DD-metalloendopeptidase family protein [Pelagibacterium sp.]|uniref:peptidoglycan DD-metalloendopeptidase family protein n=1 Tax=Pelagibacterium sp. TaxID=1967288 RepID=UPI003BAC6CA4
MIRPPLAVLVAALAVPAVAQEATLDMGRERTEAFISGDLEPIWDEMTPQMQEGLGSLDDFSAFHQQIATELGEETAILDEEATTEGEFSVYTRIGEWSLIDSPIVMEWSFDTDGMIAGFFIQPQPEAAPSARLDYETRSELRLPFDGEWYVFWGGRDIADNYHAGDPAQRFAYDFVVKDNGQSHAGDPQQLENYHCWGREILAPADGQVIAMVNDLPDQPIGETDAENAAGNHVILALAEDEFAFLAHMRQGSVTVQRGQEVARGDVLGLCGNSGNTSEPHLHFHLQTTPDLMDGEGLPAQFQNYEADGEPIARGEPVRGQAVAPASS